MSSVTPASLAVIMPRTADRSPVHRALDALTAVTLDAQRLRRGLSEGTIVTAEHREALRRVDEQLQQLRASLVALNATE